MCCTVNILKLPSCLLPICSFSCRNFDARRECNIRKYSYILPAEIIGIRNSLSAAEIDRHLSDFNDILSTFEVSPLFNSVLLFMLLWYVLCLAMLF